MSVADKLTTVAENMSKVYEAGKKAEYDRFWDAHQENGNRTNYNGAFAGWYADNYHPKYSIAPTAADYMFYGIKKGLEPWENGELDFSKCANFTNTFLWAELTYIGELDLSSRTTGNVFYYAYMLITVDKLILKENDTLELIFLGCSALKSINEIQGSIAATTTSLSSCPRLTRQSIETVINALSATTSGLTVTFSKTAVNNIDWTATEYGSFENLAATKQNWNIALI